jgi:hypothetical protein
VFSGRLLSELERDPLGLANHPKAVFRIHMFLGLKDPDPLVRGLDPDPDPSIIKQK